jgi:hypothetical protein
MRIAQMHRSSRRSIPYPALVAPHQVSRLWDAALLWARHRTPYLSLIGGMGQTHPTQMGVNRPDAMVGEQGYQQRRDADQV